MSTSNVFAVFADNLTPASFTAAYFTRASLYQLSTVDDIPGIQELHILEGVFKCTRLGKKNRPYEKKSSSVCKPVISTRPHSPLPAPFQYQDPEGLSNPLGHHISGPQLLLSDSSPSMDPPSFTASFSHYKLTNWSPYPCSESPSSWSNDLLGYGTSPLPQHLAVSLSLSHVSSMDSFGLAYQPMQNHLSTPLSLIPGHIPISPSNLPICSLGPFPIPETPNGIQSPVNLSPMASMLKNYPESCTAAQALAPYGPVHHRGPLDENKMTLHTSQANPTYFY